MSEPASMNLQKESQEHSQEEQVLNYLEIGKDMENLSLEEERVEEIEAAGAENPSISEDKDPDDRDSGGKEVSHERKDYKEGYTAQFDAFKAEFELQSDSEIKLQLAIHFMETSLGQGGTPHFRSFWEARRMCLSLFKENIAPSIRGQLWTKYSDLSKEARRLKEILDEQSAFAVEQIEIAIQALELEISKFDEHIDKAVLPELLIFPQYLKENYDSYLSVQRQLAMLNAQAARINALRKELLKTEMRVRHKNKFFQRLSSAGDSVFPKRKELIKQISQQFAKDVEHFINAHFGPSESKESFFVLREEIKAFQGLAKVLTLNTHSFTQTRTHLSECWDKLKVEEKERKKERAQQKVVFRQNAEDIENQIHALKEAFEKGEATPGAAQKKMDEISNQMRKTELGRDELRILRDGLGSIRKLIQEKGKVEEEARQQQENERNRQKKEKYLTFKAQVERLLEEHESYDADSLIIQRDNLSTQIQDSTLSKSEKQEIERLIKPLRDIITEKKEKALLALSDDDRQSLQQMKEILSQRKERRQDIKNQLEVLRKAAGSSSLDFEKAMSYTSQINEEKERLDKANLAIKEIEKKISEVQVKIRGK